MNIPHSLNSPPPLNLFQFLQYHFDEGKPPYVFELFCVFPSLSANSWYSFAFYPMLAPQLSFLGTTHRGPKIVFLGGSSSSLHR